MDLKDFTKEDLEWWLLERGEPPYRAEQVLRWLYRQGETDFSRMTNLPLGLRTLLGQEFQVEPLALARVDSSKDGTQKFLFALKDGRQIESVLIPDGHRLTLCLSSQVGCAMGCRFCATARVRPVRNLRAGEIVGQVWEVQRLLGPKRHLTNLVFMGMGEPLANYTSVVRAIKILTAEWGMGFSPRRITVSTVGILPQMCRLIEETRVQLAVSLTATTDALRLELMPISRRYPLAQLLDVCRRLPLPPRKRITFEYVMLAGVNDREEDARRLARLLYGIRAKVNLIPFHPFPGSSFLPSPRARMDAFRRLLLDLGIHATIRESRGIDIQAACGQLAAGFSGEGAAERV